MVECPKHDIEAFVDDFFVWEKEDGDGSLGGDFEHVGRLVTQDDFAVFTFYLRVDERHAGANRVGAASESIENRLYACHCFIFISISCVVLLSLSESGRFENGCFLSF